MWVDGLTSVASSFSPKETLDRLEAQIKAKGLTVFARVDHAAGAAAVGMALPPPRSCCSATPAAARRSCWTSRPPASTCR